jgi:hypothetical protein
VLLATSQKLKISVGNVWLAMEIALLCQRRCMISSGDDKNNGLGLRLHSVGMMATLQETIKSMRGKILIDKGKLVVGS